MPCGRHNGLALSQRSVHHKLFDPSCWMGISAAAAGPADPFTLGRKIGITHIDLSVRAEGWSGAPDTECLTFVP